MHLCIQVKFPSWKNFSNDVLLSLEEKIK
jgi:hypothetical protein